METERDKIRPSVIPIFPLPGAILFPRSRLPLNIFEPRYLAMIDDVLKTEDRMLGMIQPKNTSDTEAENFDIGCAGRIVSLTETDDGRYHIILKGISRFRMGPQVHTYTPYNRFNINWTEFNDDNTPMTDPTFNRDGFLAILKDYFAATQLNSDWDSLAKADEETLIHALGMLCPFATEEKQLLIESSNLTERRKTLETLMRFTIASPQGGEQIQ